MNSAPPLDEAALKENSRRICIREGAAWAAMDGFGSQYITPYALAIGATNRQIGLLNSLPGLMGSLSQLLTLRMMGKWSRKRISVVGVAVQALSWAPILLIGTLYFHFGVRNAWPPAALIAIYVLFMMGGAFAGPAWNSWMKDLVDKDLGAFFGRRSRLVGAVGLVSMLAAGFILDYFKHTRLFLGFTVIFTLAMAGRFMSVALLRKQYEPAFTPDKAAYFTFFQFLRRMAGNNFGRFTIFVTLFSAAIQVNGPFLAVYMIRDLGFSYSQFMSTNLSATIASMLILPTMGRFADRYGCLWLLRSSGRLIALLPFLWCVPFFLQGAPTASLVVYLCAIQVFGGAIWAGFSIASGNFIYDAVTRQRMAICVSYYSVLTGAGNLLGAGLGGWLSSFQFSWFGLPPLFFVFLLSGVCRFLAFGLYSGKIREVRPVTLFTIRDSQEKIFGPSLLGYYTTFKSNVFRRLPFMGGGS